MAELSRENLFVARLPAEWRPLVELLRELDALVSSRKEGEPITPEQRASAARLRAHMIERCRAMVDDFPPSLRSQSPEFKRWFTEAALLWPWFAEAGGPVLVDTVPTVALHRYPIDLPGGPASSALKRALARVFGWSVEELAAIEERVLRLTSNLRLKQCLTRELARPFQSADARAQKGLAVDLMRAIHGDLPWRPADVDVVITSTALFLCLPYRGTSLVGAAEDERPPGERRAIAAFLDRVRVEQQSLKSIRFPAFGIFDGAVVAPALVARLTAAARLAPEFASIEESAVAETLATMVTVLPTMELEKFLVHDVWGHGWQQTLCEFEWKFRQLAAIGEPLGLASGAQFAASAAVLARAFTPENGDVTLPEAKLLQIVEADLRGRIEVGMNLVVAESLADLIEHKFSRCGSPLPSSSLLPESPLRLDLSIADARLMIRAWRAPYRRLLDDAAERERLREDLVRAGAAPDGLDARIEQAARWIDRHFEPAFQETIEVRPLDGTAIQTNVLERILLGVATFDAAVDKVLAEGDQRWTALRLRDETAALWQCPHACVDLLALLAAWFYEQERQLYVWHLDELLGSEIGPTLDRLEEMLRSEVAVV